MGGVLGGVTGTGITGLGGVTEFIGSVRGGSGVRFIGGSSALPRLGSIVRPRGGSPVERSGMNLGAPTAAVPAPVCGAAPSNTDVVGEKIRGLATDLVAGPDSKTDVGAAVTGTGLSIGGVAGLVIVIGMAGMAGAAAAGIAGCGVSLPKRRLNKLGFCGSAMGSGIGVGAATTLGRTGAAILAGAAGELGRDGIAVVPTIESRLFGVVGVVDVTGALGTVVVFGAAMAFGVLDAIAAGEVIDTLRRPWSRPSGAPAACGSCRSG